MGWHVEPLARELVQVPTAPLVGAVDASHEEGSPYVYTRTWPALSPLPSFPGAPIATRVPSGDIDTEYPDSSPAASPSMSAPSWVHVPPLSAYTRTWPRESSS